MRKSKFKEPKQILVFNGARILIAIFRSLHSASNFSGRNLQSISFSCSGRYISTGGYYFRHISPEIEIELSDIDTLNLMDYDTMCGQKRKYHSVKDMARRRKLAENKRKSKNNTEEDSYETDV